MTQWMSKTKQQIKLLKKRHYYDNWSIKKYPPITFVVHPSVKVEDNWYKKRLLAYQHNAKILQLSPPEVTFYVYPSIKAGEKLGIIPAICMIKEREIHGHLNQSPGHELTHILLGQINSSQNLPAHGFWQEGICTYLNHTNTDQKKHLLSLNLPQSILTTPWQKWRIQIPGNLYPLAGSVIQYLVTTYNWKKLISFLANLKNLAQNQDKVALKIFSRPLSKIQQDWLHWIKKY